MQGVNILIYAIDIWGIVKLKLWKDIILLNDFRNEEEVMSYSNPANKEMLMFVIK